MAAEEGQAQAQAHGQGQGQAPRRGLIWRLIDAFDPQGQVKDHVLPRFHNPLHDFDPEHNAAAAAAGFGSTVTSNSSVLPSFDPRALAHVPRNVVHTEASHLIPPNDKLLVFRALTGIDSVPTLNLPQHSARTALNVGIYARVVEAEQSSGKRFKFFNLLMNICLGIQVVAAAAITALGAASGPHGAVTAFGALNTIMAGILTYLNGSGLPDRLKHYQNEWRNIREYIEQRERELCLVGCPLDVEEEVQTVEQMYEGVKREIESTKSGGENRGPATENTRRKFLPPQHHQQHEQQQQSQYQQQPHYQPQQQQQPQQQPQQPVQVPAPAQVGSERELSHSPAPEYGDPEKHP